MMGTWKRDGNHSPPPPKINWYRTQREMKKMDTQFQTPTKQTNYPKEHNEAHKNILKEEITENFMEMLLGKVNQNVQEALKEF
jgi:hypothetical protein